MAAPRAASEWAADHFRGNPDMRVSLSMMRNKTDRNDAHGIAHIMHLGWFRAVRVKRIEVQKLRSFWPTASF
jgi:transposase